MPNFNFILKIATQESYFDNCVLRGGKSCSSSSIIKSWFDENFYELFVKMNCEILNNLCEIDTKIIKISANDQKSMNIGYFIKMRLNHKSLLSTARKSGVKLNIKYND